MTNPLSALLGSLLGDFVVDEYLDEGGQATLFKGHHSLSGAVVALKVYGPARPQVLQRALLEAQHQARIDHPAVLKLHPPIVVDNPTDASVSLLVVPMPFAELGNAVRWTALRGRVGVFEISALCHLCEGVKAIHDTSMSHNDLKPHNLLLFSDGDQSSPRPVIADFGIARLIDEFADPASRLTPEYSAPEQIRGQATIASDVYALGATIYYLLTGQIPIELPAGSADDDLDAWARAHETLPRPDVNLLNRRCPVRLALLIVRMMSVSRIARPSIEDCLVELKRTAEEINGHTDGYVIPAIHELASRSTDEVGHSISNVADVFDPEVHRSFGRELFIVRVTLPIYRWQHLTRIFELASTYFGASFSFYETYGRRDIIIRVWSSRRRLDRFLDSVQTKGDARVDEHVVERVSYPNLESTEQLPPISPTMALALQERIEPYSAMHKDYVLGSFESPPRWTIKAFTFVVPQERMWRNERREVYLSAIQHRLTSQSDAVHALYVFTEHCQFLCAIEYNSNEFGTLWKVPAEVVHSQGTLGSETFIATNRLAYESDQIML